MTQANDGDPMRELAELSASLLDIPYCPQSPTDVQAKFLLDFGYESFYGGAVGGG